MKIVYNVEDMPEDVPPGKYSTRVKNAEFGKAGEVVINLQFAGEYNDNDPCLFPVTKDDDGFPRPNR